MQLPPPQFDQRHVRCGARNTLHPPERETYPFLTSQSGFLGASRRKDRTYSQPSIRSSIHPHLLSSIQLHKWHVSVKQPGGPLSIGFAFVEAVNFFLGGVRRARERGGWLLSSSIYLVLRAKEPQQLLHFHGAEYCVSSCVFPCCLLATTAASDREKLRLRGLGASIYQYPFGRPESFFIN